MKLGVFCTGQHHLEQTFCHCEPVFGEAISVPGVGDCFGVVDEDGEYTAIATTPRNDVFKMCLTKSEVGRIFTILALPELTGREPEILWQRRIGYCRPAGDRGDRCVSRWISWLRCESR